MLDVRPEVAAAARDGRPVIALESTLIAHGLPWPLNLETARAAEAAVRAEGAVPATIAVWQGRPTVGLAEHEIEALARRRDVLKASRRDLATAVAQGLTAATTVAATMHLAHRTGLRFFATGGIGGVHRGAETSGDVSADLWELARVPVAVVCSGAKSVLDISRTLEALETQGVPVVGYGTDQFPAFYQRSSGRPVSAHVDTPEQAAAFVSAHWDLDGSGVVVAQPVAEHLALAREEMEQAVAEAEADAGARGIRGPALTPFLLANLAERTGARTLRSNQALVVANARLAARVALAFAVLRAGG
jgi:pseudouridine-5'-phosphate glycosidase